MTVITKGVMSKKKALALFKNLETRTKIEESGKEWFTDDEILELSGYDPFPRYPTVSYNPTTKGRYNAHMAEDDLIHSYDNNYEEYR
jgi:hypothetical protein